jgi:hypothetical protein
MEAKQRRAAPEIETRRSRSNAPDAGWLGISIPTTKGFAGRRIIAHDQAIHLTAKLAFDPLPSDAMR